MSQAFGGQAVTQKLLRRLRLSSVRVVVCAGFAVHSLLLAACSGPNSGDATSPLTRDHVPDCVNTATAELTPGDPYSFFAAGHTYGSPHHPQVGLHPPFSSYLPRLAQRPRMEIGFLTGDVVFESNAERWDAVEQELDILDFAVHIAPGNHDRGAEFDKRFERRYHAFTHGSDLFIILNPEDWNVSGKQMDFLRDALLESPEHRYVFIFFHEVLWWSPRNRFSGIVTNSRGTYPGSSNFWAEVAPLLLALENRVVLFAGDLGAFTHVTAHTIETHCNLTLVGSGMGGGVDDNIVVASLANDGQLELELVMLNR